MKKVIIRLALVTVCLVASGAVLTRADFSGGDPPLCYPGSGGCPSK